MFHSAPFFDAKSDLSLSWLPFDTDARKLRCFMESRYMYPPGQVRRTVLYRQLSRSTLGCNIHCSITSWQVSSKEEVDAIKVRAPGRHALGSCPRRAGVCAIRVPAERDIQRGVVDSKRKRESPSARIQL